MSDDTNTTDAKSTKTISHAAFSVREREGKKSRWTEIGVAFAHRDGKGFDILFDVVPLNGRITLRVPGDKK